jgi:hypothetical protein
MMRGRNHGRSRAAAQGDPALAAAGTEAIRWFRKAAANGDDDAKEALKELGEK